MTVGLTIKKLRLEMGMTQEELGQLLGVKKAAVQKYESGHVQNLKHDTIKKLCEIFGKNPSVFIFDEIEIMADAQLKYEVGLIEEIQRTYGKEVIQLLERFLELDSEGRAKVLNYTSDMCIIQSVLCATH
jgi:transcriptional regulator with XRE-family HTH domain